MLVQYYQNSNSCYFYNRTKFNESITSEGWKVKNLQK